MKYIYIILSLILLPLKISGQQRVYTLSQPDNTGGIYEARDTIRLLKGYGFSATASKTMNARIRPDMLVPAEYRPSGSLPDPNRPINTSNVVGTIQGTADVNPMGAAIYQIPIMVASGTAGMQPSLSIDYNSHSGNGLLGYGWNLAGMSAITRTGSNIFYDTIPAAPQLDNTDNLMLNGQRLILVDGANLQNNAKYHTQIETFQDILLKEVNGRKYFEIKNREGLISEYGFTEDSYIEAIDSMVAISWLLSKVTDINGNYMTYHYEKKKETGEFYLKEINYTGNTAAGLSPFAKVEFFYETRTDTMTSYFVGTELSTSVLLRRIKTSAFGEVVRSYSFTYTFDNIYSKLTEIKESNKNGDSYNSTIIDWIGGPATLKSTETFFLEGEIKSKVSDPVFVDFNGDGIPDVLDWDSDTKYLTLYLAEQDVSVRYRKTYSKYLGELLVTRLGDFDGDGYLDVVSVHKHNKKEFNFQVFMFDSDTLRLADNYDTYETDRPDYIQTGDFNGDGIDEIITPKAMYGIRDSRLIKVGETSGLEWGGAFLFNGGGLTLKDAMPITVDITGNGKSNFIVMMLNQIWVYEYTGTQFRRIMATPANESIGISYSSNLYFGDFNGDGKTDILVHNNPTDPTQYSKAKFMILYSGGNRLVLRKDDKFLESFVHAEKVFTEDYNRDGKSDIIFCRRSPNFIDVTAFLSSGNNKFIEQETKKLRIDISSRGNGWTNYVRLQDLTGDGYSDLCCVLNQDSIITTTFDDRCKFFVRSIVNGFNHCLNFTYKPITNPSVYAENPELETSSIVSRNLSPLYVVSSMKKEINFGSKAVDLSFFYKGMRFHKQGKGFLGFGEIEATDHIAEQKTITEYEFFPTMFDAFVKSKKKFTLSGNPISTELCENSYLPFIDNKSIFYYVLKTIITDHLTGLSSTVVRNYKVEDEGNPFMIRETRGNLLTVTTNVWEAKGTPFKNRLSSCKVSKTGIGRFFEETKAYTYDGKGRLLTQTDFSGDPKSVKTSYSEYDNIGNPHRITTSAANCKTYSISRSYDATGRFVVSETDPLGNKSSSFYEPTIGNLLKKVEANGLVYEYNYDAFGGLVSEIAPGGMQSSYNRKWSTNPGWLYEETMVTPGVKDKQITYYDASGNADKKFIPGYEASIVLQSVHNNKNQKTIDFIPSYDLSEEERIDYSYDGYGRLSTEINQGRVTSYTYDHLTTTVKHPDGTTSSSKLNNSGLTELYIDAAGDTVRYDYWSLGKPVSIISNGLVTSIDYDSRGYKKSLKDPNMTAPIAYEYDAYGRLEKETNARGTVTTYQYDVLGRIEKRDRPGETVTYEYVLSGNGLGKLKTIKVNDSPVLQYTYDSYGNILSQTEIFDGNEYVYSYSYDEYFRRKEQISPSGLRLRYNYDDNSFLTSISDAETNSVLWRLDRMNARGQITQSMMGNGVKRISDFDKRGILTFMAYRDGNNNVDFFGYEIDPYTGNVMGRSDEVNGRIEVFGYDNLKRLTSIDLNNEGVKSIRYLPNGNIDYKFNVGEYKYEKKTHAVTAIEKQVEGYSPLDISLIYNASNRIIKLTQTGTTAKELRFDYGYDDQRRKMAYYENGTLKRSRYYFRNYEKETVSGGTSKEIDYIYTPDGLVAISDKTGATRTFRYVHTDHLGSIKTLVSPAKTVLARYCYDAWGVRTLVSGTDLEIRGFTGHEHLSDFGLINMNARLYDPVLGRFMGLDPNVQMPHYAQNFNRYSYALNNPLSYTDPSGESIIGALLAGFIAGAYQGFASGYAAGARGGRLFAYIGFSAVTSLASTTVGTWAGSMLQYSGFASGAVTGAAGGLTGGFLGSLTSGSISGASFGEIMKTAGISAGTGLASGAVIGGLSEGLGALKDGFPFLTGKKTVNLATSEKREVTPEDMQKAQNYNTSAERAENDKVLQRRVFDTQNTFVDSKHLTTGTEVVGVNQKGYAMTPDEQYISLDINKICPGFTEIAHGRPDLTKVHISPYTLKTESDIVFGAIFAHERVHMFQGFLGIYGALQGERAAYAQQFLILKSHMETQQKALELAKGTMKTLQIGGGSVIGPIEHRFGQLINMPRVDVYK